MIAPFAGPDAHHQVQNGHKTPEALASPEVRIGFVTCVHPFYDLPSLTRHRDHAIEELKSQKCDVMLAETPRTAADAATVAASLREGGVDLVVLFFCTWVDEDVSLALARSLMDVPMLIWALPYLDRDIPMPSPITGLVATGSNIRRLGKPFAYLIGHVTEERVQQVARAAKVAQVARQLRRARFGLVGSACPGMVDVQVDENDLHAALGITTVHIELDALLQAARTASLDAAQQAVARLISITCLTAELSDSTLLENLRLYVGMKDLVESRRLDAYCVRCWPELRDQHKITPCAAHALMARDGVPSTCEIDLMGLITTFILTRLAGTSAFSFDITGYLEDEGAIQFGHCGAADPALAADPSEPLLRRHMRTGTGATVEFPFKEGTVTLAKLIRPSNGKLKLFVAGGSVIRSQALVRGSVAVVRPEPSSAAFMDAILQQPVEHHLALVYGDWRSHLAQLCTFTGMEYVQPSR